MLIKKLLNMNIIQDPKKLTKQISILLGLIVTFSSTTFLITKTSIFTKVKDIKLTQDRNCPERCCLYDGIFYPVGTIKGPYICRSNGSWKQKA